MKQKLPIILYFLVFLFSVSLFALDFGNYSKLSQIFVICIAILTFIGCLSKIDYALIMFGLAICVLPYCSPAALNFFVANFCLGLLLRRSFSNSQVLVLSSHVKIAFVFLLTLFSLGTLVTLSYEYDYLIGSAIYNHRGVGAFLTYVYRLTVLRGAVVIFFGYILSAVLVYELSLVRDRRFFISTGLALGVFISAAAAIFQALFHQGALSKHRAPFWVMTGRYQAFFTDPNAMGLVVSLIAVLVLSSDTIKNRNLRFLFILASATCLLLSGSRTGLLFLVLSFALSCRAIFSRNFHISKKSWSILVGSFLLIFFLALPQVNKKIVALLGSTPTSRVIGAFNIAHIPKAVEGRLVFANIALSMWRMHPIDGVGLNRFLVNFDQAQKAARIDLGGWRDNANNYYLQIAAELGFVGIFLLLLIIALLFCELRVGNKLSNCNVPAASFLSVANILLVVLIILLTGPHLLFDEYRYLIASVIALGVTLVPLNSVASISKCRRARISKRSKILVWAIVLVCAFLVFSKLKSASSGFWAIEKQGREEFAWSCAEVRICPKHNVIKLRTLNPQVLAKPLVVTASEENGRFLGTKTIVDTNWNYFRLSPRATPVVRLKVSDVWTPHGGDERILGVIFANPRRYQCE